MIEFHLGTMLTQLFMLLAFLLVPTITIIIGVKYLSTQKSENQSLKQAITRMEKKLEER
ncbi:hypothetical protein IC619_009175 [Hazenella sp. IB182353]|uniref:hypothetical protein n=1 Tax=Polycladospora coralii TaxID=2771432 RepID=UPI001746CF55|nr:hypothetical protein [Polycladospora coralii]MBS7530662.1 hypothetical protein [Polycladospora coralii]